MRRQIIFIAFVVLFSSCNFKKKGIFADVPILINNFKKEMILVPELFVDRANSEFNEFSNIICLNNLVVLSFIDGSDYLFYTYNYEGDSVGFFVGHKGQGPNDLLNDVYCGQYYVENGRTYMWINDVSKMRICAIDIEKSLHEGICIIERSIATAPMIVNGFHSNDSLLIAERMTGDNYYLLIKNLNTDKIIIEKTIYNYFLSNPFSIYKSIWRIKPDGAKFVSAMKSINQLNIGNVFDDQKISLKIYDHKPRLDDIVDKETGIEKHRYYLEVEASSDYIYGLYIDQSLEEIYAKEKPVEIHVFSWDGIALCKFIIPQYIENFAVNEMEGCILGWDDINEKLYKYKFDKSFFQ